MHQPVKQALRAVGDRHNYQRLLIAFLFLIAAEVEFLLLGPTFIFMNPLFKCTFTDQLVDESQACSRLSQCQISNSYTLVAHMELYCGDKQEDRNIIQSIMPIGSILGLIIVSSLSDIQGRKFALIFVQIVGIIGVGLTLLGGFLQALWILIIAQFLCGFSSYTMMMMLYLVPTQFCQDQFLQKSLNIINVSMSIGTVIIGVLYYFYNLWYNFLAFVVLIPMVAALIICIVFLVEGPYFLYGKNKMRECLQSLKTIAKLNNSLQQFQVIQATFPKEKPQHSEARAPSLLSIIKDKQYLRMIIILTLTELGANLYFFATGYALDQIGYEYGANMIAFGIVQFAAYITLSLFITKIPRKVGLITFYGITIALGLLFYIDSIRDERIPAFVLMSIIHYFFMLGFTLILLFLTTEAFPMNVQATCAGIIEAISQLGSFLGPIVITFCINFQIYPIIAISFLALATILIPLLFMKVPKAQTTQVQQSSQKSQIVQALNNSNRQQ